MIWQLVTIICGSILGGEAWIHLRDKRTRRATPRRANPPAQPRHTIAAWARRSPETTKPICAHFYRSTAGVWLCDHCGHIRKAAA